MAGSRDSNAQGKQLIAKSKELRTNLETVKNNLSSLPETDRGAYDASFNQILDQVQTLQDAIIDSEPYKDSWTSEELLAFITRHQTKVESLTTQLDNLNKTILADIESKQTAAGTSAPNPVSSSASTITPPPSAVDPSTSTAIDTGKEEEEEDELAVQSWQPSTILPDIQKDLADLIERNNKATRNIDLFKYANEQLKEIQSILRANPNDENRKAAREFQKTVKYYTDRYDEFSFTTTKGLIAELEGKLEKIKFGMHDWEEPESQVLKAKEVQKSKSKKETKPAVETFVPFTEGSPSAPRARVDTRIATLLTQMRAQVISEPKKADFLNYAIAQLETVQRTREADIANNPEKDKVARDFNRAVQQTVDASNSFSLITPSQSRLINTLEKNLKKAKADWKTKYGEAWVEPQEAIEIRERVNIPSKKARVAPAPPKEEAEIPLTRGGRPSRDTTTTTTTTSSPSPSTSRRFDPTSPPPELVVPSAVTAPPTGPVASPASSSPSGPTTSPAASPPTGPTTSPAASPPTGPTTSPAASPPPAPPSPPPAPAAPAAVWNPANDVEKNSIENFHKNFDNFIKLAFWYNTRLQEALASKDANFKATESARFTAAAAEMKELLRKYEVALDNDYFQRNLRNENEKQRARQVRIARKNKIAEFNSEHTAVNKPENQNLVGYLGEKATIVNAASAGGDLIAAIQNHIQTNPTGVGGLRLKETPLSLSENFDGVTTARVIERQLRKDAFFESNRTPETVYSAQYMDGGDLVSKIIVRAKLGPDEYLKLAIQEIESIRLAASNKNAGIIIEKPLPKELAEAMVTYCKIMKNRNLPGYNCTNTVTSFNEPSKKQMVEMDEKIRGNIKYFYGDTGAGALYFGHQAAEKLRTQSGTSDHATTAPVPGRGSSGSST